VTQIKISGYCNEIRQNVSNGDVVEAELRLKQFVLEYPHFVGAYVNLAILYERDNRHDDAHEALDLALAINPAHAPANNQLGILLRKEGRFAEAEQAYRRAIDADPEYALAHHNLGVLLDLYMQRPADALEHYQRYQDSLAEPDVAVARWIIDLRRRLGITDDTGRVAQGDG
jgi:tetratricopeptide (TPR) repeat protein